MFTERLGFRTRIEALTKSGQMSMDEDLSVLTSLGNQIREIWRYLDPADLVENFKATLGINWGDTGCIIQTERYDGGLATARTYQINYREGLIYQKTEERIPFLAGTVDQKDLFVPRGLPLVRAIGLRDLENVVGEDPASHNFRVVGADRVIKDLERRMGILPNRDTNLFFGGTPFKS
jgi:hypothetical protein